MKHNRKEPMYLKEEKKKSFFSPLRIIIIICCLAAIGYASFRLISTQMDYRQGEQAHAELEQFVSPAAETAHTDATMETAPAVQSEPLPVPDTDVYSEHVDFPEVDFAALQEINPDIIGWIVIDNTEINYPVLQGPDNEYYLERMYNKVGNGSGSIYLDYRNARNLSDRNNVLFGHNMQNYTMFYGITMYRTQEFYDSQPTILLMTPEQNYVVELFAGYPLDPNTGAAWNLTFDSDEAYAAWLADCKERSEIQTTVTPTVTDRILTMSTCVYDFDDARYILQGVLRKAAP